MTWSAGWSRIARRMLIAAASVSGLVFAAGTSAQNAPRPFVASFASACEAFRPVDLVEGEAFLSAEFRAATNDRPAHCSVRGSITTSSKSVINYRVDLPAPAAWNSKLMILGGGGFDGYMPTDFDPPVTWPRWRALVGFVGADLGSYVLASTDSGHKGRGPLPMLDMSWAADNPDAITNHAYRANHLTLWAAVRIAKGFYGRAPARRYMLGLSNGGRQGLMAAQRYPDDYDGIIALAPAISQVGFAANMIPVYQHMYKERENWLSSEAVALYVNRQIAACDGLDGLKDGVIGNYKACAFEASSLTCPAEEAADPNRCLTPGQVQTIGLVERNKRIDVPLADGMIGYPGYGVGAGQWSWPFIFGTSWERRDAADFILVNNLIRVITNDPNADVMTHDPTKWREAYLAFSKQQDATNPDLSAFFAKGGKIILWYGTGDRCVAYARTEEYVRAIEKTVGALKMRESLRFFVSPVLGHQLDGAEADTIPFLRMLEDWVEKGRAPNAIVATKLDDSGSARFARPLCEVGKFPKYKGRGDGKLAGSFVCSVN